MSQTPPEIEALIWSIAESGDAQAVAEFESRFPEHRLELLKRVNAVQELRRAKGQAPVQLRPFRPTPQASPVLRFGRFALGGAALVGVAFASYWVSGNLLSHPAPQTPGAVIHHEHDHPRGDDEDRNRNLRVSSPAISDEGTQSNTLPVNPSPIPPTRLPTPEEKPITLHVERANLLTLLDGLAQGAGWDLEIAPGTPDPEVRVDYDQVAPTQILQDMGKRFGFTAFDEGNHKILIVPARDGTGPYKVDPKTQDGDGQATQPGL